MSWCQKMIADMYRYAWEALDIKQYEDEEKKKDENSLEVPVQALPEEPLVLADMYMDIMKERKGFLEKSHKAYAFGTLKAEKGILAASPLRLGLALNFAVFTYEVLQDKEGAKEMANKAIELGNKTIEKIEDEEERQDADTIIDMLTDNVKQWEDEEESQLSEMEEPETKEDE